jgi:hypothetical protein
MKGKRRGWTAHFFGNCGLLRVFRQEMRNNCGKYLSKSCRIFGRIVANAANAHIRFVADQADFLEAIHILSKTCSALVIPVLAKHYRG